MDLNNIESAIDPVIMDRGREYVHSGRVRSVEKIGDHAYRAQVQGSKLYRVLVELGASGAIASLECACPFDDGPVCKHQAAVLLMIRPKGAAQPIGTSGHWPSEPLQRLKGLLERQSKDRLIALLLSLAEDSELVERRIRFSIVEGSGDDQVTECRRLIQSYIAANSDRHGFVDYRGVSRAVEGAQLVMEKTREDVDWRLAVKLSFCVLEEMLDLLQAADDSNGTIGGVIDESLERVHEIASYSDKMPESERPALFRMLLTASGDSRLDGWSDWQLTLLRWASEMAVTFDLKKEWDRHVTGIAARQKGGDWSREYLAEQVAMMQYQWICDHAGDAEAEEFLQRHQHFPNFRKWAIEAALKEGRYDDAMQLAQDGEVADQARGLPGLVKQWKEFRYQACARSGRVELQRAIGQELVQDGDYAYYQQIKDTYPSEEWSPVYHDILRSLEGKRRYAGVYTRILVEEQETERLLEYVQQQPARIEEFHRFLIGEFRPDVIQMFQVHIESTAAHATTRTHYQNVCRIIRMLQQAGGQEEAVQITRTLLNKYSRKPALREELMQVARP